MKIGTRVRRVVDTFHLGYMFPWDDFRQSGGRSYWLAGSHLHITRDETSTHKFRFLRNFKYIWRPFSTSRHFWQLLCHKCQKFDDLGTRKVNVYLNYNTNVWSELYNRHDLPYKVLDVSSFNVSKKISWLNINRTTKLNEILY